MAEFKGYKKGYTESDFKDDKQTVKTLGRYDWDKADYRYAEQARKYKEARMRVQKQTAFNLKNGIDLDSARQLGEAEMYDVVEQLCAQAVENAMISLMEGELNVQSVTRSLKEYGYDPDWCTDDYLPEIQNRINDAQAEIARCCADLLLYNLYDLNSSRKLNASADKVTEAVKQYVRGLVEPRVEEALASIDPMDIYDSLVRDGVVSYGVENAMSRAEGYNPYWVDQDSPLEMSNIPKATEALVDAITERCFAGEGQVDDEGYKI